MTCFPEQVITHYRYRDSFILSDLLIQHVTHAFPRIAFVQAMYLCAVVSHNFGTQHLWSEQNCATSVARKLHWLHDLASAMCSFDRKASTECFYKSLDGLNPDAVLYLLEFFWAAQHRPAIGASTI